MSIDAAELAKNIVEDLRSRQFPPGANAQALVGGISPTHHNESMELAIKIVLKHAGNRGLA